MYNSLDSLDHISTEASNLIQDAFLVDDELYLFIFIFWLTVIRFIHIDHIIVMFVEGIAALSGVQVTGARAGIMMMIIIIGFDDDHQRLSSISQVDFPWSRMECSRMP